MIFFLQTRVSIDVEDKHATQTSVPIPPPTDEVDITSDVIKSIPTDDIDLIKFVINTMLENNYNKKVDINEIMRELENFYLSNNLDTYKTFIIEYFNQRNSETEVMHIDFCFESYIYTYNDFYTDIYSNIFCVGTTRYGIVKIYILQLILLTSKII